MRGKKKDFWYLYEILQHYLLQQIMDWHKQKYPNQMLVTSSFQTQSTILYAAFYDVKRISERFLFFYQPVKSFYPGFNVVQPQKHKNLFNVGDYPPTYSQVKHPDVKPPHEKYKKENPLDVAGSYSGVEVQPGNFPKPVKSDDVAQHKNTEEKKEKSGMRLNFRPAEKENSQQGEKIGTHVGQVVERGAKLGLQFKDAGNVPVEDVADQTDTQKDNKPLFVICQRQHQDNREDDQPVKTDCIRHIQNIFPSHIQSQF